jgi:hypothetical protein
VSRRFEAIYNLGVFLAAGMIGCSSPGSGKQEKILYPDRVHNLLKEADRLQDHGWLREAIELIQVGLVDFPTSPPLQDRLAELRSMRQVCFMSDWNEARSLIGRKSFTTALVVLERIVRYGDEEMIRRAREKMEEIRSTAPNVIPSKGPG